MLCHMECVGCRCVFGVQTRKYLFESCRVSPKSVKKKDTEMWILPRRSRRTFHIPTVVGSVVYVELTWWCVNIHSTMWSAHHSGWGHLVSCDGLMRWYEGQVRSLHAFLKRIMSSQGLLTPSKDLLCFYLEWNPPGLGLWSGDKACPISFDSCQGSR